MEKFTEQSCSAFAELLASKASVPGGGGAAALVGALGVALCAMVGNFTVGKKKYAAVESDVLAILEKAQSLRRQLLAQVDADARSFAPLAEAYAIPKEDPSRGAVLESATLNACKAPTQMVSLCCESIALLEEMLDKGSVMLLSDVGCGALMCKAALESAAMNVFVNTKALPACQEAQSLEASVDELLSCYVPRAQRIVDKVNARIRKEP